MTIYDEQNWLARICARMTETGIPLNLARLAEVREEMATDKLAIADKHTLSAEDADKYKGFLPTKDLKALAKGKPVTLNLNSHKQIKGYIALKGVHLVDTRFDTLVRMRDKYPTVPDLADLVDFKSFGKGDQAWFGDEYIRDSALHPRWNPTGTSERRLSCSKPNFQNVPHRGKDGDTYFSKRIRSVVVPVEGRVLVELDASQGEDWTVSFDVFKRIGDDTMLNILRTKVDFHSRTGSYVFGYPVTKATHKHERDVGKMGNHSHKYGEGFRYARHGSREHYRCDRDVANGLAVFAWRGDGYSVYFGAWRAAEIFYKDTSHESQRKAIAVKKRLMADYPGIMEWQRVIFETWRSTGMVRNSFGFQRPLYGDPAECAKRAFAFVGASNLQSIVIRGMIDVDREVRDGSWIQHAQIHDSLLASTPDGIPQRVLDIMARDRDGLVVPWEGSQGSNWSEM